MKRQGALAPPSLSSGRIGGSRRRRGWRFCAAWWGAAATVCNTALPPPLQQNGRHHCYHPPLLRVPLPRAKPLKPLPVCPHPSIDCHHPPRQAEEASGASAESRGDDECALGGWGVAAPIHTVAESHPPPLIPHRTQVPLRKVGVSCTPSLINVKMTAQDFTQGLKFEANYEYVVFALSSANLLGAFELTLLDR